VRNTQPLVLSEIQDSILGYPAAEASPLASWRNSVSGTVNSAVPHSKQTTISGNTHATGLSMLFSPGKWIPISPVNLRWLTEPHDLHDTPPPDSETRRHLSGRVSFLEWVHGSKRQASSEEVY
jgi:hypothetical protein